MRIAVTDIIVRILKRVNERSCVQFPSSWMKTNNTQQTLLLELDYLLYGDFLKMKNISN